MDKEDCRCNKLWRARPRRYVEADSKNITNNELGIGIIFETFAFTPRAVHNWKQTKTCAHNFRFWFDIAGVHQPGRPALSGQGDDARNRPSSRCAHSGRVRLDLVGGYGGLATGQPIIFSCASFPSNVARCHRLSQNAWNFVAIIIYAICTHSRQFSRILRNSGRFYGHFEEKITDCGEITTNS